MKVLNFVSSALLSSVLMASAAFGNGNSGSKTSLKSAETSVRRQIVASLNDVPINHQSDVYVYFNASPETGFELLNVTGLDNQLVNKVKGKLEKGNISIPRGIDGNYIIKVHFVNGNDMAENVFPEVL